MRAMDRVIDRFGVRAVGVEGYFGTLNADSLEDIARQAQANTDGLIAKDLGLMYALDGRVECVGLRDNGMYAKAQAVVEAARYYEELFNHVKGEFERENGPIEGAGTMAAGFKLMLRDRFIAAMRENFTTFLADSVIKPELPDYASSVGACADVFKLPFYGSLLALQGKYSLNGTPEEAVIAGMNACEERGLGRMAIMVNGGREGLLQREMRENGASYFVLRPE
jgi:hypothetical protein